MVLKKETCGVVQLAVANAATVTSGVAQPAASHAELPQLDDDILKSARALGRYPQRRKTMSNEAEREENALEQRVKRRWQSLLPSTV